MVNQDCEAGPSQVDSSQYFNAQKVTKSLTPLEKRYFLAVERGNLSFVKSILDDYEHQSSFNINCVDALGRSTLLIAIENENLEMVRLLVNKGVEIKDAILHAIDKEFVECVEVLLDYEEKHHKEGEPFNWEKIDMKTAAFTSEITPLILAGHRNNYEILKLLLDRGAELPVPHDVRCSCHDCVTGSEEDSLRHSRRRYNAYKALASPSLIALTSTDPILTAFELCWELKNLSFTENEYKQDYLDLTTNCQNFAMDLLAQARSSSELEILLNYDPQQPPHQIGDHMSLARLKVAIAHDQKQFVAHPNVQQLLTSLWYEGLPGFRRKNLLKQILEVIRIVILFPFYSIIYMIAPTGKTGKLMRKPFMKFLIHSSSYLFFLLLLILASQRVEALIIEILEMRGWLMKRQVLSNSGAVTQRGNTPSLVEWIIFSYIIGFIWQETKQMTKSGLKIYISDMWNMIEFIRNTLYVLTITFRLLAFIQAKIEISEDPSTAYIPRERWNAFDPMLISEGLFAAANIFSALKLLHMFSINPYLGPLQISLGRMAIDIIKFFFIYSLVLFSFACGLNQLLWYYADLEKHKCYSLPGGLPDWKTQPESCMMWRRFFNLFEASQSLFWASFGMIDLRSFELSGIQSYSRFWAMLMFGSYSVINVIVLLNLLIAMMSNSYNAISDRADVEWKFARTKLWLSYFDEGSTVPPPFNMIPTPKSFLRCFGCCKKETMPKAENLCFQDESKNEHFQYQSIVQALVWRYVVNQQKKTEVSTVTEDHINEVKQDISSFRYEVIDALRKRNLQENKSLGKRKPSSTSKKTKDWERQLLSDFSVTPVESCSIEPTPQDAEAAHTKFQRLVRMVGSSRNRTAVKLWKDLAYAVRKNSQIFNVTNEEETVQPLFNAKVNDYAELAASNEAMNLVDDDRREDKPNSDAIIQTQEIIQIIQHHDEPLSNSNINEGAQEEEEIIPTNPMDKAADDVDEPQNHSQIVDSECDHVHDVNTTGTENISERCISTVNSTEHESQLENSNTLHNTDNLSSDSPKTHPKQANILSVEDDATHENLSLQRQDSTSRKKDADEIVNETFPSDAINNEVIPTQLEQCSSSSTKNSTSLVPQSFLSDVINNEQIPTQLEKGSSNSSSSSSSLVPQTILNPSEFLGLSNVLTLKHQENSPWL